MKSNREFKVEILAVAILAILLIVLWTISFGHDGIDITFHDSYLVVKGTKERIWVLPVLFSVLSIYVIKEAFYGYKRRFQNMVLLTTTFLFNAVLLSVVNFVYRVISPIKHTGWIIYPLLSALPKVQAPPSSSAGPLTHLILFIQIFFLLVLVIIAILTGKNWNNKQSEN